ncbi:MAG: hypothetical protein HYY78_21990 [Betaproteobacteria bacterium]|nr:hypothetical protein [Betaproteobacteria bacterium]
MGIHQIQIRHDETEDRLLLRFSTSDGCEFRFWLTRRFTKRLWGMLVKMLEWDRAVQQQVDPGTRRTVLDIQHEGYARQANYSKAFEEPPREAPRRLPLGEAPVLLAKASGKKRDDGVQMLGLHPLRGQGIDISLDTRLLHIFTRLLREQVARTDWDVNLALHEELGEAAPAQDAQPRKLN